MHFELVRLPVVVQVNDALVEVVEAAGDDVRVTVGGVVLGRAEAADGRATAGIAAINASVVARLSAVAKQDASIDGAQRRRTARRCMGLQPGFVGYCGVVAGDAKAIWPARTVPTYDSAIGVSKLHLLDVYGRISYVCDADRAWRGRTAWDRFAPR